jgi:hypothetical protein
MAATTPTVRFLISTELNIKAAGVDKIHFTNLQLNVTGFTTSGLTVH